MYMVPAKSSTDPSKTDNKSRSVVGAPSQHNQSNWKGKHAWRKNVNIDDVEEVLEGIRAEERVILKIRPSDVVDEKIASLLRDIVSTDTVEFRESIRAAIPRIIALLSDSEKDVRKAGADALSQLSEQVEFRESIRPVIPQIIALLSDSEKDVRKAGADALSKLSELVEFRESIQSAIPQIIAFLSDIDLNVRNGGVDALLKVSEQAEFRESIRTAIPQIIALIGDHRGSSVRGVGVRALLKLSEQAELRESIRPAIPQIIAFISDDESHVRIVGVDALSKLSEQVEFRESIRPVIPHIIALISDGNPYVRSAGASALSKLSEQVEFRESIKAAIPQIIALISDSVWYVRIVGVDAVSKLSKQAESIRVAIPQIITLPSHREPYVHKAGADASSQLSKQDEFRESIRAAIPQIIALLRDPEVDVRKAGADALSQFSEQVDFRESIRAAIPRIIALLSDSEKDIRKAGVDALSQLSEQVDFRESIRAAIPRIIALLGDSEKDVRKAGADALSHLSEQAEFRGSIPLTVTLLSGGVGKADVHALHELSEKAKFRQSIVPAIHRITPPLRNIYKDVHNAGAHALAEHRDQGINADTVCDLVASDESEYFEATTCWIAAEHALQHARSKISSVCEIFYRWKIQETEYVVHAGFDESLIKSGVGYLEQIHVFVSAKVDASSPLLSELGRIFSPFSSILFTESSSYHLPVFKDDGNVWEFDELVYFTASKFADGGSSSKMPLTVISLSQTPSLAECPTGFSQGGSGSGEGEHNEKQRSDKGKERDSGDEDETDRGDKNDKDPGEDPEEPSGDRSGTIARLAEISFEIVSEIYLIQDEPNAFQTLTMHGSLTIQTTPLAQSPRQFSKRHVQFTELAFDADPIMPMAYKQFHVRVVVNSQQKNARVLYFKPKRSDDSDGEEKQSSSKKTGQTRGVTAGVTAGPHPLGAITVTAMKAKEETAGSETKRYTSRITEHHNHGVIRWGFNVDDRHARGGGIDMRDDVLPTAHFQFVGDSDVPAPPPERMEIAIASYWSMILPSEPKSTWIPKFLRRTRSSGDTQTASYSNLIQIVALKMVPSNLPEVPELSYYRATVKVRSGASDPPVVERRTGDSVDVTPAVVDDLQKLSTLNLPMIAKFKLSDNCIRILGSDSKSY